MTTPPGCLGPCLAPVCFSRCTSHATNPSRMYLFTQWISVVCLAPPAPKLDEGEVWACFVPFRSLSVNSHICQVNNQMSITVSQLVCATSWLLSHKEEEPSFSDLPRMTQPLCRSEAPVPALPTILPHPSPLKEQHSHNHGTLSGPGSKVIHTSPPREILSFQGRVRDV